MAGTLVSACMPLPMIPPPTTSTSGEVFRASSSVRILSKQWTADRLTDGDGRWRAHSRTRSRGRAPGATGSAIGR